MRSGRRRGGVWLGVAALVAAAVAAGWLGARSSSGEAGVRLSILDRPAAAADSLPPSITASGAADQLGYVSARLAATAGARKIYVVRGRGSSVCLVVAEPADQSYAADCADRRLLAAGTIYLSMPHPGGTLDVVGVVDDRVASAEQGASVAATRNNVFVLDGVRGEVISLARADGIRSVDLGPQSAPLPAPG